MAQLDYYNGRALEEIIEGEEDWQWALKLSGDAIIKNWDKRRGVPDLPLGMGLLMVILEIGSTQLVFGRVDPASSEISDEHRVVLTPTQYSITDPQFAAEEEFPQRNIDEVVLDPGMLEAEMSERTAEGPEVTDEEEN